MSNKVVPIEKLADAVQEELLFYHKSVNEKIRESAKKVMRQMVKETKAQRFKQDTGAYRKAISSRPTTRTPSELVMTWYVKAPHYRLSHLLEFGHATRSGGRTIAYGFIGKAEKKAVKQFQKEVEEAIKNG